MGPLTESSTRLLDCDIQHPITCTYSQMVLHSSRLLLQSELNLRWPYPAHAQHLPFPRFLLVLSKVSRSQNRHLGRSELSADIFKDRKRGDLYPRTLIPKKT